VRFASRSRRRRRSSGRIGRSRSSSRVSGGSSSRVSSRSRSGLSSSRSSISSRRGVSSRSSRLLRAGGQSKSSGRSGHSEHQFERHRTDPSDGSLSASGKRYFRAAKGLIGRRVKKHKMLKHCELYSLVSQRLKSLPNHSVMERRPASRVAKGRACEPSRCLESIRELMRRVGLQRERLQRRQTATGALMCASGA
jgi:hypothetical protein